MVEANRESWILARMSVQPRSTVLLGTSRMQTAVDPAIWAATAGGPPPVMLAVAGEGPLPMLTDLAHQSSFRGHVIAEMMPAHTFDTSVMTPARSSLSRYLAAYQEARTSPAKRWEAVLRTKVPSHLAFRRIELLPGRLVPVLIGREPPLKRHFVLREDHYRSMHFRDDHVAPDGPAARDNVEIRGLVRRAHPLTAAALDSLVGRIKDDVTAIQRRGGSVTFVLFQACGTRKDIENRLFPKSLYWNRLLGIPGVRTFDSDDYPQIGNLPCYDGSHVDVGDAPMITRLVQQADR